MATFKRGINQEVGGYFETLKNLAERQKEQGGSLRTNVSGVESLTKGEQTAEQKAVQTAKDLEAKTFKAPEVAFPTVQDTTKDVRDTTLRAQGFEKGIEEYGLRGQDVAGALNKIVSGASAKVDTSAAAKKKEIEDVLTAAKDALEAQRVDAQKWIDKTMTSTAAKGEVGQKSEVESNDFAIAEAMQDPSMRTSDIAQLSKVYPAYDYRLAAVQGQIMRGELADLRASALEQLQQYGAAQGATDYAVANVAETEKATQERLGNEFNTLTGKLETGAATAQEAVNTRLAQDRAALDAITGRADEIATKGAARDTQIASDSISNVRKDLGMFSSDPSADIAAGKTAKDVVDEFVTARQDLIFKRPDRVFSDRTGRINPDMYRELAKVASNQNVPLDARNRARETINYLNSLQYTQASGTNDSGDKAWVHEVRDPSGKIIAKWYSRR